MNIIPIHAFKDNYIWMFFDASTKSAWVVDPGDASPVIAAVDKYHLHLAGILITHHHPDHTGGVAELLKLRSGIAIYGSHKSTIPYITHPVKECDEIECGPYQFQVLEIPGHTLDHIAFYNQDILFSGDTLFSAGCGKVFEGTPGQMYDSLQKLLGLHETINLYCGHEYTLANLNFAHHVDPYNTQIEIKMLAAKMLREEDQPTLPSTLLDEKKINPFLRCTDPDIIQAVEKYAGKRLATPVDVFAHLREWKNNYP